MKKIVLFILIFFITTISTAQDWLTDTNFDKVISSQSGFGDSEDIIVIEFWADFNKQNAFVEWQRVARLDGVRYYRADIAKCPQLKAKYKIRMVPTILIFSGGVNFEKLSRAIGVVRREDSF